MNQVVNLEDLRHGIRVANLSIELAKQIQYPKRKLNHLYLSGLFHDVGKAYLDQKILNKPGMLTKEERIMIEQHPVHSYDEVISMGYPEEIALNILYHHENWNGTGYPTGLKGTFIPLASRILKLTDVFDALTMERPYRDRLPVNQALLIMTKEISNYDPEVYQTFHILISKKYKEMAHNRIVLSDDVQKIDYYAREYSG